MEKTLEKKESMKAHARRVLGIFEGAVARGESWDSVCGLLFGQLGCVDKMFPSPEEIESFHGTVEYLQIMERLRKARIEAIMVLQGSTAKCKVVLRG
tara:strand:- start:232 stop:522 length:291 start_codon:yes stop_codon:yes gene_type:complete